MKWRPEFALVWMMVLFHFAVFEAANGDHQTTQ